LDVESYFSSGDFAHLNASAPFGTDTNSEWDPSVDLGPNHAYSSWSGGGPFPFGNYVVDFPSTPYFKFAFSNNGSNLITRVVSLKIQSERFLQCLYQ